MPKAIAYIFYDLEALSIIISFVYCLPLINNKNIIPYMKGFYWYGIVGIVILIPSIIAAHFLFQIKLIMSIINLSSIFHYMFLGSFIRKVISKTKELKIVRFIYWMFLGLIISVLIVNKISNQINQTLSISNLGLSVLGIFYYYELFNTPPLLRLKNDPAFWIITGVFFAMSVHIPISATIDFFKNKIPYSLYLGLGNITLVCYTVMHIFFTKALICTLRGAKTSIQPTTRIQTI